MELNKNIKTLTKSKKRMLAKLKIDVANADIYTIDSIVNKYQSDIKVINEHLNSLRKYVKLEKVNNNEENKQNQL